MRVGDRHAAQPGPPPDAGYCPSPGCSGGDHGQARALAVTFARATGEGSPEGAFPGRRTGGGGTTVH